MNKECSFLFLSHSLPLLQQVKTGVIKNNVNPEWNADLTLYVQNFSDPIRLVISNSLSLSPSLSLYVHLKLIEFCLALRNIGSIWQG